MHTHSHTQTAPPPPPPPYTHTHTHTHTHKRTCMHTHTPTHAHTHTHMLTRINTHLVNQTACSGAIWRIIWKTRVSLQRRLWLTTDESLHYCRTSSRRRRWSTPLPSHPHPRHLRYPKRLRKSLLLKCPVMMQENRAAVEHQLDLAI